MVRRSNRRSSLYRGPSLALRVSIRLLPRPDSATRKSASEGPGRNSLACASGWYRTPADAGGRNTRMPLFSRGSFQCHLGLSRLREGYVDLDHQSGARIACDNMALVEL